MKRQIALILITLGVFSSVSAIELQIAFYNRIGERIYAPVTLPDGNGPGAGYKAQLFWVQEDGQLQALYPETTFFDGPDLAKTLIRGQTITIPGMRYEQGPWTLAFVMRAWKGDNWATATVRGESAPITIEFPTGETSVPSDLEGLQAFSLKARPVVTSFHATAANQVEFLVGTEFSETTGTATVEKSMDLVTWTEVGTVNIVDGVAQLTNSELFATQQGYFRLRMDD